MIHPDSIEEFLGQTRTTFEWIKTLNADALEAELRTLNPPPDLPDEVSVHQLACFLLGVAYPQFAFLLDMGMGKTLLMLILIRYWMKVGKVRKALVLVPTNTVVNGWEEQIEQWAPDLPYQLLQGPSSSKWDAWEALSEGLGVITYQGLALMVSEKEKVKGKTRKRFQTVPKLLRRMAASVDALILDESTAVKRKGSLWFRAANAVAKHAQIRYALAGRAFGRDPEDLWAQFYLVDRGASLGDSLTLFRDVFYKKTRGYWTMFEYKFDKAREPLLAQCIANRSIEYHMEEGDLPPLVESIIKVRFPEETEAYYQRVVQEVIAAKGNYMLMKNAFLRMRQISSGFLGFRDDETGDKAEVEFDHNPKLDALLEKIEEMPRGRKMVVFYEFTWSGRRICEALKKAKIGHEWLWSGTEDQKRAQRRFKEDPRCTHLVLNHRLGAYGLNLQSANYHAFYESPVSPIDREQAERRTRRTGQSRTVFQYDLVMRDTVDQRILDFHAEGDDLFNALVRDPSSILEPKKVVSRRRSKQ